MHRLQLGPGVNAKLVGESPADRLVRSQRLRLPSGRGQRPHEQPGDLLVQRVMGGQNLERPDVPARWIVCHLARQPGDHRVELQPLQPLGVRGGELARVGQRGPPPQPHRPLHVPLGQQPLEPERVHVRLNRQPVPGRRLLDRLRLRRGRAGPGTPASAARWPGPPGGSSPSTASSAQFGRAHRPPPGQREPHDQVAQPRAGDDDRGAPVVTDLKPDQGSRPAPVDCRRTPAFRTPPRRAARRLGRHPPVPIRGAVLRMLARALRDGHDPASLHAGWVPARGAPQHNGRIAQRKSIRLTTGRPQVRSLLRPHFSNSLAVSVGRCGQGPGPPAAAAALRLSAARRPRRRHTPSAAIPWPRGPGGDVHPGLTELSLSSSSSLVSTPSGVTRPGTPRPSPAVRSPEQAR